MTVELLLFASYREQVGARRLELDLPEGTRVRDVAVRLESEHSGLSLRGALCAINEHYVAPDAALSPGDRVAFFPPVSGGGR